MEAVTCETKIDWLAISVAGRAKQLMMQFQTQLTIPAADQTENRSPTQSNIL
jgi:hypothetical protein